MKDESLNFEMSFRKRGNKLVPVRSFHFVKDHVVDGKEFETIKIVHILTNMEPSALGVAGGVIDHVTPGITDLMASVANREFIHRLNNAVGFLAMKSGVQPKVSITIG